MKQVKFGTLPHVRQELIESGRLPASEIPFEMESFDCYGFWEDESGKFSYLGIRDCDFEFSKPPRPWNLVTKELEIEGVDQYLFWKGKCKDGVTRILAVCEGEEPWR